MPDRSVTYTFKGNFGNLTAGLVTAGRNVQELGVKMTALDANGRKMRSGLTTVGSAAGKMGLVAAAGLGAIVVATTRFEQSMSRVQAAAHASASTVGELRNAAIVAGRDTIFSATESADAITAMSKAGVSAKDILNGGLTGALSLASAGELDVASAADIAATAMNQFGLQGKDIPHIADLLAAAAGKAQGEVTDMANSLKYVGPVAHQMGISIDETTGTIAELASQGILGEQAGTSLRGMLTALTSPSKIAASTMKSLGINLYDATGNFVGLRGVAGELSGTMGKLSNAERDQALGRIFGNEQITAARILYAGGAEAVDKWTSAVNDQGYAADTAAIKLNNLSGDLEQLKGSLETALIGAGSGSQAPLRTMVQDVTNVVNAFNKMPSALQGSVTGMLAITAITGGGLWFGSKVIKGISDTRAALENLQVSSARTKGALSAIGKGLTFVAVVEGLNLVEKSLDSVFNQTLDQTDLGRSLTALAQGNVTGEFLKKYGTNLQGFAEDVSLATDKTSAFTRAAGKIPLVGDLLAAPPWTKSVNDAAGNIKTLDEALAGLVESGQGDQAAAIFDRLTQAAVANGQSAKDVKDQLEQYGVAVENAAASSSGAAKLMSDAMTGLIPATDGVTSATGPMGAAVQQSAADLKAQADALDKSRKAAAETADSFFGIGKSVNDSKVSLSSWIDDLNKQAAAMRNFTKNIQWAKKHLDEGLVASLEKAGPEGAMRLQQLANASESEIARANRSWRRGEAAVNRYIDVVGGVPPKVGTDLTLDGVGQSAADIARYKAMIAGIPREVVTRFVVKKSQVADAQAHASGGRVIGPGTPTSDSIPAYLSNGEYVVRAAAVEKYGVAMFDGLNAMRLANGGYASGGNVRTSMAERLSGTPKHELKRFKEALDKSTQAIRDETQQRDDLVQQRDQLASSVSSKFQTDIFGDQRPSNWAYMSEADRQKYLTQTPINQLQTDIGNANTFQNLLAGLVSKGLSGNAFAALAQTGDIQRAQAFAGLTPAQLAQYQALFDQRANVTQAVGAYAGGVVYNAQIDVTNGHLAVMQKQNDALQKQVDHLEKAITAAAHDHAQTVTAKGKASATSGAAHVKAKAKAKPRRK